MRHYLVGGAVRDRLLERPVGERDWLVTGVDADQLVRLGYQPVGKSFRVFLHPSTQEEHALPRGDYTPEEDIAVARDLELRDLTINAIARSPEGEFIDPLNGREDLQRRILRHAPGFRDDPLRVLRLARFTAGYADLGFRIADETRTLVHRMVGAGELAALPAERCWKEIEKGLAGKDPVCFFETLRMLDALQSIMPELERLFGVPQPQRYHPEIDTGKHSLLALHETCRSSEDTAVRLAALLHDLGKGTTPRSQWPRHLGHEQRGAKLADRLCRRLRTPTRHRQLAALTAELHTDMHRAFELKPATLLRKLKRIDALRRPERLRAVLLACAADLRGRPGYESRSYPQADYLAQVAARLRALRITPPDGLDAADIAAFIGRKQCGEIAALRSAWPDNHLS